MRREIPPGWFAASNSLFVLLLTAPLAALFRVLRGVGSADKIVAGLLLAGGCVRAARASRRAARRGWLHPGWLARLLPGPHDGELLLSPVGLSLVSKLSPPRWIGVLLGCGSSRRRSATGWPGRSGGCGRVWSHARFFGGLRCCSA